MKLEIRNAAGDIFDLPKDNVAGEVLFYPKPSFGPITYRASVKDRAGRDGGKAMGDRKSSSRSGTIKIEAVAETDADYLDALNALAGFLRAEDGPFYLVDTDAARRFAFELDAISDETTADGTTRRVGKVTISLTWLDAYWEDLTPTTTNSPTGGLANLETMAVVNAGDFQAFPIFRITCLSANDDFVIRNVTNSQAFALASSSFLPGVEYVVDSRDGSVTLADVEASATLADGSGFISLDPGTNSIRFESAGGDVEIEVEHRSRYAF